MVSLEEILDLWDRRPHPAEEMQIFHGQCLIIISDCCYSGLFVEVLNNKEFVVVVNNQVLGLSDWKE